MARTKEELQQIIGDPNSVDEASLTDQQLADRLSAYQELGGLPQQGLNLDKLREALFQAYQDSGYTRNQPLTQDAVGKIVDYVEKNGNLPDPGKVASLGVPGNTSTNEAILNPFRERLYSGEFTPGNENTVSDTKRVQDLIDQRKFTSDQQAALDQFQVNTPQALQEERDKFFAAQQNRAQDYVANEYAPQVVEQLGARGLADSGEVGNQIAGKYGEIQSTIEQERAAQEASDIQFFSDMAFKTTYQDLINAHTNIQNNLDFQNTQLRQKQQQDFTSAQNDIQSKFNMDIFKQENERSLNNYRTQVDRQKKAQDDQFAANLVGQGVQTAGNVAILAALG